MAKDKDLEKFLQKWLEPPPKAKKPAAEIMLAGGPYSRGPRREQTATGNSRWVTRLGSSPNLKRLTRSFHPL